MRHDLREVDSGQFRPRNSVEVHASALRDLLTARKQQNAQRVASLFSLSTDSLMGLAVDTSHHAARSRSPAFHMRTD